MDHQAVYNRVRDHLLAQGERCAIGNHCNYSHGKLKCAIGALILDEHYSPALEGMPAHGEIVLDAVNTSLGTQIKPGSTDAMFLRELQYVHDDHDPGTWRETLTRFAIDNGLQP